MYVKLFGTILDSSIWGEDNATRIVWITMLAMSDEKGIVQASDGGIAHRARVSTQECRHALDVLAGPDLDSKNKDYGGRRIERVDSGGWVVLNYGQYREIRTKSQIHAAIRQQRFRDKRRGVTRNEVTTEAEAEAEADSTPHHPKDIVESNDSTLQTAEALIVVAFGKFVDRCIPGLFAYYRAVMGKTGRYILDDKRQRIIRKALVWGIATKDRDGLILSVSELLHCFDGARKDDWIMGRDPKAPRAFDGIDTILRDRTMVERLRDLSKDHETLHPRLDAFNDAVAGLQ